MKIKVKCISYKDDLRFKEWPTFMCCRPMVGDTIQSRSGDTGQICEITHTMEHNYEEVIPLLLITLTKRQM